MRDSGNLRRVGPMLKKTALVFIAALIGGLWMSAPSAHACKCRFPSGGFIGPKFGRLPANAVGVPWYTRYRLGNRPIENLKARSRVEIREERVFRDLPVKVTPLEGFLYDTYVIAPEGEKLKPGATYRFTVVSTYRSKSFLHRAQVTIDREKLSAETRMTLDVGPVTTEIIQVSGSPSCRRGLKVSQASIKSKLPHGARQWGEQLLYRTIVDGKIRWHAKSNNCSPTVPGRSWEGVGHDRVYAPCKGGRLARYYDLPGRPRGYYAFKGIAPGRHTLSIAAFLPGAGVVLKTPVKSVNLRCR